jgi:hypothetical protein
MARDTYGPKSGKYSGSFFQPEDVAFSSSPGGSTPANTPEKGIKEGTGVTFQEGVSGSLNNTPDKDDFIH